MLPDDGEPRVGYVLKMYPRFSETFVVTEILAREELGDRLEIFSLRPPVDARFHESLARVSARVTYLPHPSRPTDAWSVLRRTRDELGNVVDRQLPEILAHDAGDACQALDLATRASARGLTQLHAHFGSVAGTVARLAGRLAGIPYSVTLHAKDIFHESVDEEALGEKIRDASPAVTVSDYNLHDLQRRFPEHTDRLVRVYNGIDLDLFPFTAPTQRPPVVVGVGRLVEKKGFAHLVDAVALLVARGRRVRLDLVGDGVEADALHNRVAQRGLTDLVRFHGVQTQAETREHLRGAAIMAAPCVVGADGNRDGLPTTILESLALGTPVVATPVTGIPEAVLDGRTGLLVPEGDVPALAAALDRLVSDAALRCRLAEAGRTHVEENFDARRNARLLHDLTSGVPDRLPAGMI